MFITQEFFGMRVDADNSIKLDTQIMSMRNGNFRGFSTNEWICLFDKSGPLIFHSFKIHLHNSHPYKAGKSDGIKTQRARLTNCTIFS
ncbi:Uncharacterised protein [Shigella sonnei]|nr:Uncharacterised protein [Shigella sonnei]CST44523.1 Uncharacterised protein [Shigella sonnei]